MFFRFVKSRIRHLNLFIIGMAEQNIKLPATPERTKSNSTNLGEKTVPHYLRASTGSCHDHCKYGNTHVFLPKPKRPIRRKVTRPTEYDGDGTEIVVPVDKNKAVIEKPKSSSDPKTLVADSVMMPRVSSPSMKSVNSLKRVVSSTKDKSLSAKVHNSSSPKSTSVKLVSSPNSSSLRRNSIAKNGTDMKVLTKRATSLMPKSAMPKSALPKSAMQKSAMPKSAMSKSVTVSASSLSSSSSSAVKASEIKKGLTSPIASLSPKASISRGTSLNARKTRSLKMVSPVKNLNRVQISESNQQSSSEIIPEKTLHVIKMETVNKIQVSVENSHPGETKITVSDTSPKRYESLNSAENGSPAVQSSPPSSSLSIESIETESSEDCKRLETDKIKIPAAPLPPSSSLLSAGSSSTGSASQSSSSHEEDLDGSEDTESEAQDSIREDNKRNPRKARLLLSEDKDGNPVKLSFRRGKVVDLQSETNSTHKLRFRQGRVLGENRKGDAQKRSYKKREETVTNNANLDSEKVVLRHQDVQGKKDLQGLFNNVIEQTAGRLAETRRSKVKALVGAFETVISLQDKKSTTNTTS